MAESRADVNGEKMDREMDSEMEDQSERDDRGRFVKGWSGGPGRGKSTEKDELEAIQDLIELVEVAARDGIVKATGVEDRIKAARIALKVAELKKPEGSGPVLEPHVVDLMELLSNVASSYSDKVGNPTSPLDVLKLMVEYCPNCEKFGMGPEDLFEEITDGSGDGEAA
jgi:hypothetical protein